MGCEAEGREDEFDVVDIIDIIDIILLVPSCAIVVDNEKSN